MHGTHLNQSHPLPPLYNNQFVALQQCALNNTHVEHILSGMPALRVANLRHALSITPPLDLSVIGRGRAHIALLTLEGMGVTRVPPEIARLKEDIRSLKVRGYGNTDTSTGTGATSSGPATGTDMGGAVDRRGRQSLSLSIAAPELGQLTHLVELELMGDHVQGGLPSEIGRLTMLRTLRCSSIGVTSLPSELGRLPRLNWLDLTGNALTRFPVELLGLNLVDIDIGGNVGMFGNGRTTGDIKWNGLNFANFAGTNVTSLSELPWMEAERLEQLEIARGVGGAHGGGGDNGVVSAVSTTQGTGSSWSAWLRPDSKEGDIPLRLAREQWAPTWIRAHTPNYTWVDLSHNEVCARRGEEDRRRGRTVRVWRPGPSSRHRRAVVVSCDRHCAVGCWNVTTGDGQCMVACNTTRCGWDGMDCVRLAGG